MSPRAAACSAWPISPRTAPSCGRRCVTEWAAGTVATVPPPSVGGVCLLAMLRLLDGRAPGSGTRMPRAVLVHVQRAVLGHRRDVLDAEHRPRRRRPRVPRPDRQRPRRGPRIGLHRARLGRRQRRPRVLGDRLERLRLRHDRRGHRHLAEQLSRRAGAQPGRPVRLGRLARACSRTWRRPSDATATERRSRSDHPAPTGSPPRSRRCSPATSAAAMSLEEAICHPRVHVHRAGRPDEQIRVETDLTMYFGGVGAALSRPDGGARRGGRSTPKRGLAHRALLTRYRRRRQIWTSTSARCINGTDASSSSVSPPDMGTE